MANMDFDKQKFYNGELYDAYKYFGCQFDEANSKATFRVWAPRAVEVSVVGDFNDWSETADYLYNDGGVWSITLEGIKKFDGYKYCITTADGRLLYKSDPYAFHSETHSETNSKVYDLSTLTWNDAKWIKEKEKDSAMHRAINIYEAHIGSWRKYPDDNCFDYRKFADDMTEYLVKMNYTHIELMGIAEYPYDGSWGYQVTGYFAPTSRYGTPHDFAYMVNKFHENNIGIILDWVPGHFPKNANGLYEFDGYPLYEPTDELMKEHKEWGTRCFDYGRNEVSGFLISNAMYWFDMFHIDGLRVDAVASTLYLDYNRKEWRPNKYGGHEHLEAVEFYKKLNASVFASFPGGLMIAEESTAWPLVTKPTDVGGLGFNFKWNMGWMNDTLSYIKTDPLYRAGNHNKMTFSMSYAFSENFVLPVSHDEVVYGKCSLLNKMPGEYEGKFAQWRNYLMYMIAHPGKKLTFMGTEFAQFIEWNYQKELDWQLLKYSSHKNAQDYTAALNKVYKDNAALWQIEDDWSGFDWRVVDDNSQNVFAFTRTDRKGDTILVILNFSGCDWCGYHIGCDEGVYTSILTTDSSGFTTKATKYKTIKAQHHNKENAIVLDIKANMGMLLKFKKAPVKKVAAKKAPAKKAAAKKATAKKATK